jgi:hypothetical protein
MQVNTIQACADQANLVQYATTENGRSTNIIICTVCDRLAIHCLGCGVPLILPKNDIDDPENVKNYIISHNYMDSR